MKGLIGFGALLVLQLACAGFLLWDIMTSLLGLGFAPVSWAVYELVEVGALAGLVLGVFVSASMLSRSRKRQEKAESNLRLASGAFMEVLEERFREWELTPAERDVTLFAIKGLSIAEIANVRNTSEGTVKAQTNAIYRKAGVSGRAQLLSVFLDELIGGVDPDQAA